MKLKSQSDNKKRVLIIDGSSQQALPLIKGFNLLGFHVVVYSSHWYDAGRSYKYTDEIVEGFADFFNEEKTKESIFNVVMSGKYDLVIPTEDFFATILSKNKNLLSKYSFIYVNDWTIYQKAIDKLSTMTVCMEKDIPCPKTVLVNDFADIDVELEFPVVVKPRTSFGARGFNVVYNKEDLQGVVKKTEEEYGPVLVQEYIPQTDKQYQVEMVMGDDGECKAFVLMDKVRWYPLEGGSSTCNVTIHDEQIKRNCVALLSAIRWRGYASLDLIRDPRDGQAKIMEINPRINGTAKICFAAGVDLSLLIAQEMYGKKVESQLDYKDGVVLRYFHKDILWFLKSKKRFNAKPSWFVFKDTVDEIFGWDDLRPAILFTIASLKKLIQKKYYEQIQP